jgi:hypothetical protein
MYRWLMSTWAAFKGVSLAGLVCLLSGCGGSDGYDVSGNVTFDGKPVPAGKIYFSPDGSKGNSGATGYATITGGKYDTADIDGRPTAGGAMTVRIEGWDPSAAGQQDKNDTSGEKSFAALFPSYETTAELAEANATQDFDIPAEAANRQDAPETGAHTGP